METVIDEIARAVATLKIPEGAIRILDSQAGESVYCAALERFVSSGDRRWWWEAFREPTAQIRLEDAKPWLRIPSIVPNPNEVVWFMVEEGQLPYFPIYETTPQVAAAVVGECYGFEYYLFAKDLSWIVCENHHGVICTAGRAFEEGLRDDAT